MANPRPGWVPVKPTGFVLWAFASHTRAGAIQGAQDHAAFLNPMPGAFPVWRELYRAGWRIKKCVV